MGRTVVFDDGVRRAALISLDLVALMQSTVAEIRAAATIGSELEPTDVMITCSHTHRAPYVAAAMDYDADFEYLDWLRDRLVVGVRDAWAARQPARLRVGRADAPGWTFNRRQIYETDMGQQVGTQGPEWVDNFVRREGPEDDELKILVAEGLHGDVLGGLVNFACHPTVMGSEPVYSADFCGPLVDELSRRHGGCFAFLQGAAGNLWSIDMSTPDGMSNRGSEYAHRMARALADKADEALASARAVDGDTVRMAREVLHIPQRRPTAKQVELAKWYLEDAPEEINEDEFTRQMRGRAFTFFHNSPDVQRWFAREAIGMWEWQRRAGTREMLDDVEIQAIAVGDVAFVGYPAEYFTEFGLRTKAESPFEHTFVLELANGCHGYVPTREAFGHGGYETRLALSSHLIPEAGDAMCDAGVGLLGRLAL